MKLIRPGSQGPDVRDVQQRLVLQGLPIESDELEGTFGASTDAAVRAFQQRRSLVADGIVGPDTWGQLVEASWRLGDRTLYLHVPHFRGDDVRDLQRKLNALGFDAWREDGILGSHVDTAIREFQRNVGVEPDGIVGPESVETLARLRPDMGAPGRHDIREAESLREIASLAGTTIAIDSGHGPDDPGATGPGGIAEEAAAFRIATALHAELGRRGARPMLLRSARETPDAKTRAEAANGLQAAVCVSIHLNDGDASAGGATCFYFGTDRSHSPAGQRLAELVQEELVARTGLMDCRIHPMAPTILRETRMPAVMVEPCFITNAREASLLGEEAFVTDIARAIAIGLERFLGPEAAEEG